MCLKCLITCSPAYRFMSVKHAIPASGKHDVLAILDNKRSGPIESWALSMPVCRTWPLPVVSAQALVRSVDFGVSPGVVRFYAQQYAGIRALRPIWVYTVRVRVADEAQWLVENRAWSWGSWLIFSVSHQHALTGMRRQRISTHWAWESEICTSIAAHAYYIQWHLGRYIIFTCDLMIAIVSHRNKNMSLTPRAWNELISRQQLVNRVIRIVENVHNT